MFSEEIVEKIFSDADTRDVPIIFQCKMIHAIERILERENFEIVSREEGEEDV